MEQHKSSNPIFGRKAFEKAVATGNEVMTLNGTINKTVIMLLLVIVAASFTFRMFMQLQSISAVMPYMIVGVFGGIGAAIVTIFKKEWSMVTAPLYALFEGLFLGGISALFESMYPGLVIQAVLLTFGVFFIMLTAYRTGIIKPTKKLVAGIAAATGAIFLVYLVNMVMSMFGASIPMIHSNGIVGIIFSLVVVGIAAFNLIIDFAVIEDGVEMRAPKFMEWYGAWGLMVTLIWLYLEILKLLAKLASRD